jgi:hypothetical protein
MTKAAKLLDRFLSRPKDFSYDELRRLLSGFGYEEVAIGKTSGSRVAFINRKTKHIIRLHKPHPEPQLKRYQIEALIDEFRKAGVIL